MVNCQYHHITDSAGITSLSGAAGRMVKDGDKTYTYGYLDKILSVQENGEQTAAFDYHVDGQIASATHGDKSENFLWDGLALIHRGEPVRPAAVVTADAGGTSYINEPYVTGGNPILSSKDGVMFNDMLGNTIGTKSADAFSPVNMTAFGETADKSAMFTGKPYIGDLGYAFLFRNYRPNQGKWNSADPLGYPDGWNNLAYCNNGMTDAIDYLGTWAQGVEYDGRSADQGLVLLTRILYFQTGNTPFSLFLLSKVINDTAVQDTSGVAIPDYIIEKIKKDTALSALDTKMKGIMKRLKDEQQREFNNDYFTAATLDDDIDVSLSIHGVAFYLTGSITKTSNWTATLTVSINDPYDFNSQASNPVVAALGRLYDNGWLTKFSVKGSFSYTFKE